MPERKFIDLKALKVSDEGPGSIEGYRSVFGEIDEGGDLVVKGAFADCHDEYMHSGFTAESHIWDFKDAVGFPIEAKEDDFGWFVKSQFHSTPDAQTIRTKAKERLDAGKSVGFSFGYKADEYSYIEAKDFKDQLPQFIKPERLADNLAKAQRLNRVRILKKVSAIEDSIVTSPMNKKAGATAVKSTESKEDKPETKALFEDLIQEREESMYFLTDVLCSATYRAQFLADTGAGDLRAMLTEILSEFTTRWIEAIAGPSDEGLETMANSEPLSFKGDLRDRLPFAKHAEAVLGAVEAFAQMSAPLPDLVNELTERRKQIIELRESKAGAMYSGSNLSHMTRVHDALGKVKKSLNAAHADMGALIDKAKKPEKSEESELDVAALRTHSLRIQSQAVIRS